MVLSCLNVVILFLHYSVSLLSSNFFMELYGTHNVVGCFVFLIRLRKTTIENKQLLFQCERQQVQTCIFKVVQSKNNSLI